MELAASLTHADMRLEGYMAVAVTCAELKDIAGVKDAVDQMTAAAKSWQDGASQFALQLSILNVVSALIDNSEFEAALSLIETVEQNIDQSQMLKRTTQLQRAFLLAQQQKFHEARLSALKIPPDSGDQNSRGVAFRTTALLQTKAQGPDAPREWALRLTDPADRAYALLGISQALLDIGQAKLPYSVLRFH